MGKIIRHSIIENIPFWILAGVSIAMGITAFFLPPKAEVHPSVLRLISWFFAFAALWTVFVAMVRGLDTRITHGKTSVAVGNFDDKNRQRSADDDIEEDEVENG